MNRNTDQPEARAALEGNQQPPASARSTDIQTSFDQAIAEKRIRVYFQPIVRAINGKVCNEEALARWIDPDRGLLFPEAFIPELEACGQICQLALYVLEQVLEKIKLQREKGLTVVPHSINLSRADFAACDIVEEIRRRVDAAAVSRTLITIELTENIISQDFDFMKNQVERFRQLGFPVWMDDFGKGFSSLEVLRSIKFDLIKFDIGFLRKLNEGDSGKIILTDLLKMVTSLGVDTVCEGVETKEQVPFLQEVGCSKLQGFCFCRPIPAEEAIAGYTSGVPLEFENPMEAAYYETIGRINLYDLAVVDREDRSVLQNVFNALPIGILEIKDDKARCVRSSHFYRDFMLRFFGVDVRQQILNFGVAPAGYGSVFLKMIRQCCEEGGRTFFDDVMPDGTKVHTFIKRIGVNPMTGSVAIVIAVLSIRDANEKLSIEQTLQVIEQLGERMPGGFFIYKGDERGELLYANKEVCAIYGCDSLEDFKAFSGFTFQGMIHPDDYEKTVLTIQEQVSKSQTDQDHLEYRIIRKDGATRWIDDYGQFLESDIYHGLHFVFISDITDKHEQAESDKAMRSAVIEALTKPYDSVWLINDIRTQRFELFRIDPELVHLMPAHTAMKIEKFSEAFAFYSKLVLEEDRQKFLDAVQPESIVKNTEDRLIYSVPFRRVFENGIKYYRVEFARLDLPGGKTGIVTGFKNVDEEVRKDQQIQQALREAIDAANASNRAKSDFLSSMSHDMRTPMNGIIGMTTIAANHLDDRERVADCLRKISDSSSHLLSLINDVLDMSKIESGKVELHEEEFSLAELIDGMLAMTRPQIQAHGHAFRVNIMNVEHEQLIGDSRRIEQVFVNIMSNAIKYTPDGGKISLSVKENPTRKQGYGYYQFIFEDNGYGMTEEFLKHLFEPFARAKDKQTASIQGTGLGMAITRNIVRMMGGDIAVESVYGEGSKFTVNMYLKLQHTEEINYDSLVGLHVLVADDDPVCCESTCEMLGDMGITSEWVLSGKAAVDRVKARQEQGRDFFTVIVDWKLPDQGGVETTRQIRQIVGKDVPIIIFSAYDWTEIEEDAREAGATAFISKPLFRTKLAALFDSLVNKQSVESGHDAPLRQLETMGLILLTEDQELNAEIATDFLEMTGAEVDWARDGKQAVQMLADSPDGYYSMIFMDIQMPNMNGYEATRAIRAMDRPYAKQIPIVAMTANAFAEDVVKCKNAGMNEHITKRIDIEVLAKILETYVK